MVDPIGLPDLSGRRILVVDDNDDHAELMHAFLRPFRAEVRMVRNVDAALGYLSDAPFDLLISDLAMPGKDGLVLIRAIRAAKTPYQKIPAIGVTGFYEQYARNQTLDAGFNVFVRKPIQFESLVATLRDMLGRAPLNRDTTRA
jgi:CheY-like chemotaxis protein